MAWRYSSTAERLAVNQLIEVRFLVSPLTKLNDIMLVWILILTFLVVLMFIVLVVLGLTILKHIEAIEEEIKDICCRTPFIQGIVEAIADMVRK